MKFRLCILCGILFCSLSTVWGAEYTGSTLTENNTSIDFATNTIISSGDVVYTGSVGTTGTTDAVSEDIPRSSSGTSKDTTGQNLSSPIETNIDVPELSGATKEETQQPTTTSNFVPNTGKDEVSNAITRMYANGLTKFPTKSGYMPDAFLTREQMAKMVVQAYTVLGYEDKTNTGDCSFSDFAQADPTLQTFITRSCELGLLKGRNGAFHNKEQLTKAQAITILIRIFEGEKSNENLVPRWQNYVNKAQAIGLTNDTNYDNYDRPISRGHVALLFYRFKGLVENKMVQQQALQEMQGVVEKKVEKIDKQTLDDSLGLLTQGIAVGDDPELREAVFRMYQQGMTKYKNAEDFRAFDQIERQEATKFIGQFHQKFIKTGEISGNIPDRCYFNDLGDVKGELKPYVIYACQEHIFDGQNGWFYPTHSLRKSEFVASLIRMLGKEPSTTGQTIRWKPYFDIALKLGLVTYVDRITFDKPITRYEVALILYRFRIKYKLLENLNGGILENQIIQMVSNSVKKINGRRQGKVYITTTKLNDQNFNVGYVELFDHKYKIVKKNIEKYFANNYVRYGEVYDMVTDKPIGTLSMIISNSTVLEGNIRPRLSGSTYYQIIKPEETNSYYILKEKEIQEGAE